jgi:hypothetical protein
MSGLDTKLQQNKRSLILAITESYIRGVSTRRIYPKEKVSINLECIFWAI